jgi:hypothetical protein
METETEVCPTCGMPEVRLSGTTQTWIEEAMVGMTQHLAEKINEFVSTVLGAQQHLVVAVITKADQVIRETDPDPVGETKVCIPATSTDNPMPVAT